MNRYRWLRTDGFLTDAESARTVIQIQMGGLGSGLHAGRSKKSALEL